MITHGCTMALQRVCQPLHYYTILLHKKTDPVSSYSPTTQAEIILCLSLPCDRPVQVLSVCSVCPTVTLSAIKRW